MRMIQKIKVLSVVFLSAILVLVAVTNPTQAETNEMSQQHIDRIRENCLQAKNALTQLHSSDALLRVNRGQLYESISTKLMSRFNSRLSASGYGHSELSIISSSYAQELDQFRKDYIVYEEQLSRVERIDCTKQPVAFYDAVIDAREKRQKVRDSVVKLNKMLDSYRLEVSEFESRLLGEDE